MNKFHDPIHAAARGSEAQPPSEEPPRKDYVHEKDGSTLVYVQGGVYTLGAEDLTEIEQPVHRIRLSPFLIGKYQVTNELYGRFLEANPGYRKPAFWGEDSFNRPLQPVVGVSWEDAMAYCNWAGLVLPTEAQWEAAARGGADQPYPWGAEEPGREHANFGTFAGRTTPVGSFPSGAGPCGALDLAGNVAEWCADVLDPEAYAKRQPGQLDPICSLGEPLFRVLRGGSLARSRRGAALGPQGAILGPSAAPFHRLSVRSPVARPVKHPLAVMAELVLPTSMRRRIVDHAERTCPEECCGVLVGRGGRVEQVVEAGNVAESRSRRYAIDPEVLLAVHKESRSAGRDVVGYYHSHPSGAAWPSAFDLEHAWPGVSYVIVALEDGRTVELRSFRLHGDGDRFEEEQVLTSSS